MVLNKQQNTKEQVGEDLWSLFERLNLNILEVTRLTTISTNVLTRGSFKVILRDGRVLKARCFPTAEEAERVSKLSHFLPSERFPKALAYSEKALLMEWIPGDSLRVAENDTSVFLEAGTIQKALHNSIVPKHLYQNHHSQMSYWQSRLAWKIDYLTEKNQISSSEAEKLLQIASVELSDSLGIGLTHGDFCLENMVVDRWSNLRIVDIETISVTAFAYDLARTMYRWPMSEEQRDSYLHGYGESSSLNALFREPLFWMILVLAGSVVFRHRARAVSITEPLNKLKEILEYDCSGELQKIF